MLLQKHTKIFFYVKKHKKFFYNFYAGNLLNIKKNIKYFNLKKL